jgi:Ca2+-binding RTX toxin-like protein
MRARHLVVAAACRGAGLLLPAAGPAAARGATCQGQPATITGTPGGGDDGVHLDGTSGPNVLEWNSCVGTMTGGQGADRLEWAGGANRCRGQQERTVGVYGGKGNDRLIGSPLADVLVGGPGHDIAVGAGGVDRCRAEVERGCEQ